MDNSISRLEFRPLQLHLPKGSGPVCCWLSCQRALGVAPHTRPLSSPRTSPVTSRQGEHYHQKNLLSRQRKVLTKEMRCIIIGPMTTLTQAITQACPNFWGPELKDKLWAQRWARAHKVRKAGRDYRFSPKQVEQMAADYAARSFLLKDGHMAGHA